MYVNFMILRGFSIYLKYTISQTSSYQKKGSAALTQFQFHTESYPSALTWSVHKSTSLRESQTLYSGLHHFSSHSAPSEHTRHHDQLCHKVTSRNLYLCTLNLPLKHTKGNLFALDTVKAPAHSLLTHFPAPPSLLHELPRCVYVCLCSPGKPHQVV